MISFSSPLPTAGQGWWFWVYPSYPNTLLGLKFLGPIGVLLVFLAIPHTLIGLYLLLPLRHFVYSVLAGLVIAAIIVNVFIAIVLIYGPNNEVWKDPVFDELSAVGELWFYGILFFSLFGFLLGCWLGYRKFRPSELADTRRKILDI